MSHRYFDLPSDKKLFYFLFFRVSDFYLLDCLITPDLLLPRNLPKEIARIFPVLPLQSP